MELRDWAIRILSADRLEDKLHCPDTLTDHQPGPALLWKEPTRPTGMGFTKRAKEGKLPPFHAHDKADNRAVCLHRFAGHELLAVEIMAYALLAFPEAPPRFRKGLANTLKDEQRHVRLYIERMEGLGLQFGDLPLYKHFWVHTPYLNDPISYVSTMSLTFEMANLDFAPMYGRSFERFGDHDSAALMKTILHDEIAHVSFGWNWLKRMKNEETDSWDAWIQSMPELLSPKRAKGFILHEDHRRSAGIPEEWISRIRES